MAGAGCREGEKIGAKGALVGGAIRPKGAARLPDCAQTLVMRDRVLNDQRLDPLRMRERHAEADRAPVILHIERIARQADRLDEVVHDRGDVVEGVGEGLRVWPVAMPESRIVGRDQMVAVGKPGEERLEHPRGRGQTVQQEKRRRIGRPSLPVENGEPVDLCRAVEGRMFHEVVSPGGRLQESQSDETHQGHRAGMPKWTQRAQ